MKQLRTIFILVISLIAASVIAQNTESEQLVVPLSNPGDKGHLEVHLVNGSIMVNTYKGDEIIINASSEIKETKSKKMKDGMKKLNTNSFSISAEEDNNKVEISTNSWKQPIYLDIQIPENFDLDIGTVNNGPIKDVRCPANLMPVYLTQFGTAKPTAG